LDKGVEKCALSGNSQEMRNTWIRTLQENMIDSLGGSPRPIPAILDLGLKFHYSSPMSS